VVNSRSATKPSIVPKPTALRKGVQLLPAHPHLPARTQTSAKKAESILRVEMAAPRSTKLPALHTLVALRLPHAHRLLATDKAARQFLAPREEILAQM